MILLRVTGINVNAPSIFAVNNCRKMIPVPVLVDLCQLLKYMQMFVFIIIFLLTQHQQYIVTNRYWSLFNPLTVSRDIHVPEDYILFYLNHVFKNNLWRTLILSYFKEKSNTKTFYCKFKYDWILKHSAVLANNQRVKFKSTYQC